MTTLTSKSFLTSCLIVFFVSSSYFVGSTLLSSQGFYYFDVCWRILVFLSVLFIGKVNFTLSKKNLISLLLLFCIEGMLYLYFSPELPWYRMLISVAFAPLMEEFLFRGWIMERIEGTWTRKIALTSLLFALYHLKNYYVLTLPALLYQVAYAGLVIGPIFGYVRLKTNSVFASIVLHSGNNTVADVVTTKILPFIVKRKI